MAVGKRALLIAMTGPALQAVGIAWVTLHIFLLHLHDPLMPRHIIFEPGFLVILVGFAVTVICAPLALEVAQARPEEVAIPVLGSEADAETGLKPEQAPAAGH